MKRYLAIFLSLLLLMTTIPMVSAEDIFNDSELNWGDVPTPPATPDGPYILISQTEGKVGDEVFVTVKLVDNPGLVSAKIKVHYDSSALELIHKEAGAFPTSGFSWSANTKNPFIINFCDAIAESDYTDELLAILTFKIKDDATPGATAITLECDYEGDFYNLNWDVIEFDEVNGGVYVLYPVTGVELDISSLDLYKGDTAQLTATVFSEGKADTGIIWTSDNPEVATVDEKGMVTAVGLGVANIIATTVDGGYIASCPVTVTCAHTNVTEVEAVDSTCVVPGHEAYTLCADCGELLAGSNADLPLAEHIYESMVTTEPTCVVDGVMTYTCSVCGDSYTEIIPATGVHAYKGEVTDPTCVEVGYTTYTCAMCGDSYVADEVEALGHTYDGMVTTEPTCGADGVMTYTCVRCGDSHTEAIPATGEHTFDNACDAQCNGCDLIREVPDHVYDGPRDADCNECGEIREVSLAGDANGDDKINNRDMGMLQQYLNGYDVAIDLSAVDVDQNGKINNRDLGILQQYLNGYDVELK